MTKTEAMEVVDMLYEVIGEEIVEIVRMTEAKPLTTKDHYGDYMNVLPRVVETVTKGLRLPPASKGGYAIAGLLLIKAGANQFGVKNALVALGKL